MALNNRVHDYLQILQMQYWFEKKLIKANSLSFPFSLQIAQIAKILNAHMNSLQWIEQNSGKLVLLEMMWFFCLFSFNIDNFLTWDQAQFSFRFVNNIPAGKVKRQDFIGSRGGGWGGGGCMRTAKIGPDVR